MYIPASIKTIHLTEEPQVLARQCDSKFKDTFTKAVEVFFSQCVSDEPLTHDSFILCTGIGNSENIARLIREYRNNKFVSAQLFPEATMSSAAVNINRIFGIRGGNISANPGLMLHDAILLGMLDATDNARTTHLIYGEVNEFDTRPRPSGRGNSGFSDCQKIPNHLIYISIIPSGKQSYMQLSGSDANINPEEWVDFSSQLKRLASPAFYQFLSSRVQGEIAHVYTER